MKLSTSLLVRLALLLPALAATAQAPPSAHTGCVMRTEAGEYTFCEPNACSFLDASKLGDQGAPRLAGNSVTLRGALKPAAAGEASTFVATSIVSMGDRCSQTCNPRPAGHRGLGGHEHPGSEGGTPGVTTTPPPL